MLKLKMKANPMTLMAFVLVLAAMYMVTLNKPTAPVKTVRFAEKEVVRERPAPAHMQGDPNSRMW